MRHKDWHQRLTDLLAQTKGQPAGYGWDGLLFVAAAVRAMTDLDMARGLRGYRTDAEAMRKFAAKGFDGPEAVIAAHLPRRDRPRPGDVVVFAGGGLGIWQGSRAYGMGPGGWGVQIDVDAPARGYQV